MFSCSCRAMAASPDASVHPDQPTRQTSVAFRHPIGIRIGSNRGNDNETVRNLRIKRFRDFLLAQQPGSAGHGGSSGSLDCFFCPDESAKVLSRNKFYKHYREAHAPLDGDHGPWLMCPSCRIHFRGISAARYHASHCPLFDVLREELDEPPSKRGPLWPRLQAQWTALVGTADQQRMEATTGDGSFAAPVIAPMQALASMTPESLATIVAGAAPASGTSPTGPVGAYSGGSHAEDSDNDDDYAPEDDEGDGGESDSDSSESTSDDQENGPSGHQMEEGSNTEQSEAADSGTVDAPVVKTYCRGALVCLSGTERVLMRYIPRMQAWRWEEFRLHATGAYRERPVMGKIRPRRRLNEREHRRLARVLRTPHAAATWDIAREAHLDDFAEWQQRCPDHCPKKSTFCLRNLSQVRVAAMASHRVDDPRIPLVMRDSFLCPETVEFFRVRLRIAGGSAYAAFVLSPITLVQRLANAVEIDQLPEVEVLVSGSNGVINAVDVRVLEGPDSRYLSSSPWMLDTVISKLTEYFLGKTMPSFRLSDIPGQTSWKLVATEDTPAILPISFFTDGTFVGQWSSQAANQHCTLAFSPLHQQSPQAPGAAFPVAYTPVTHATDPSSRSTRWDSDASSDDGGGEGGAAAGNEGPSDSSDMSDDGAAAPSVRQDDVPKIPGAQQDPSIHRRILSFLVRAIHTLRDGLPVCFREPTGGFPDSIGPKVTKCHRVAIPVVANCVTDSAETLSLLARAKVYANRCFACNAVGASFVGPAAAVAPCDTQRVGALMVQYHESGCDPKSAAGKTLAEEGFNMKTEMCYEHPFRQNVFVPTSPFFNDELRPAFGSITSMMQPLAPDRMHLFGGLTERFIKACSAIMERMKPNRWTTEQLNDRFRSAINALPAIADSSGSRRGVLAVAQSMTRMGKQTLVSHTDQRHFVVWNAEVVLHAVFTPIEGLGQGQARKQRHVLKALKAILMHLRRLHSWLYCDPWRVMTAAHGDHFADDVAAFVGTWRDRLAAICGVLYNINPQNPTADREEYVRHLFEALEGSNIDATLLRAIRMSFLKAHLLRHVVDAYRRYGHPQGYSSDACEKLLGDFVKGVRRNTSRRLDRRIQREMILNGTLLSHVRCGTLATHPLHPGVAHMSPLPTSNAGSETAEVSGAVATPSETEPNDSHPPPHGRIERQENGATRLLSCDRDARLGAMIGTPTGGNAFREELRTVVAADSDSCDIFVSSKYRLFTGSVPPYQYQLLCTQVSEDERGRVVAERKPLFVVLRTSAEVSYDDGVASNIAIPSTSTASGPWNPMRLLADSPPPPAETEGHPWRRTDPKDLNVAEVHLFVERVTSTGSTAFAVVTHLGNPEDRRSPMPHPALDGVHVVFRPQQAGTWTVVPARTILARADVCPAAPLSAAIPRLPGRIDEATFRGEQSHARRENVPYDLQMLVFRLHLAGRLLEGDEFAENLPSIQQTLATPGQSGPPEPNPAL